MTVVQDEIWEDKHHPKQDASPQEPHKAVARGTKRELDGAFSGPQDSAKDSQEIFKSQFAQRRKRMRIDNKEKRNLSMNQEVIKAKQIMADHTRVMIQAKRRLDANQVKQLDRESPINDRAEAKQQNGKHIAKDQDLDSQSQVIPSKK